MPFAHAAEGSSPVVSTGALWVSRLAWAALLGGQVAAAAAFAVVLSQGDAPRAPQGIELPGVAVDAGLLVVALVATVVMRRRGRTDLAAARGAYLRRTLVPMAMLEAASLAGLVLVFVTGHWFPCAIVPAASMAIQLLLFPRRPKAPRA